MEAKNTNWKLLAEQAKAIADEEGYFVPLLANMSALIMESMDNLNWAGFYLAKDGRLLLGPFQGKLACISIPYEKGVCGAAFCADKTIVVPDVHAFPGHIACDSASASEIVVPLHIKKEDGSRELFAVMDIDSPIKGRFSREDQAGLEKIAAVIEEACKLS